MKPTKRSFVLVAGFALFAAIGLFWFESRLAGRKPQERQRPEVFTDYRYVPPSEMFAMAENVVFGEVLVSGMEKGKIKVLESFKGNLAGTVGAPVYTNYKIGTQVIWFDRVKTANPISVTMPKASPHSDKYRIAKLLSDLPSALHTTEPAQIEHVANYLGILFMSLRIECDDLPDFAGERTLRIQGMPRVMYARFPWQAHGEYEVRIRIGDAKATVRPSSPLDKQISDFASRQCAGRRSALPDEITLKFFADPPRQVEGVSFEEAEQFLINNLRATSEESSGRQSEKIRRLHPSITNALASMRSLKAAPEIAKGIHSKDTLVFESSMEYLAFSGDQEIIPLLKEKYRSLNDENDKKGNLRAAIRKVLIELNAPDIREILEGAALKCDLAAYIALSATGTENSFGAIVESLRKIPELSPSGQHGPYYRAAFEALKHLIHRSNLPHESWMNVDDSLKKEEPLAERWTEWWSRNQQQFRIVQNHDE